MGSCESGGSTSKLIGLDRILSRDRPAYFSIFLMDSSCLYDRICTEWGGKNPQLDVGSFLACARSFPGSLDFLPQHMIDNVIGLPNERSLDVASYG